MLSENARQFDSALAELTEAYRGAVARGVASYPSALGACERCGQNSLELGSYDSVGIYVTLDADRSRICAASNCHYPSIEMLGEYVQKIREIAKRLGSV